MTMALSIDEIRKCPAKFAKCYENIKSEKQLDQNFMKDFCEVFGINSRRIEWQHKTKTVKWVDGFIPGRLLSLLNKYSMNVGRNKNAAKLMDSVL